MGRTLEDVTQEGIVWKMNDERNKRLAKQAKLSTIKKVTTSVIFGIVATTLSYVVSFAIGLPLVFDWITALAVITSYSCTYLCVVQSRWNYPMGILTTGLYSVLFWMIGIPGLAIFNLYLVFSLIYGWIRWKPDAKTLPVTYVKGWWWLAYGIFGAAIAVVFVLFGFYTGFTFLWLDIAATALSAVAQLMMDNKKLESWYVWLAVNAVSLILFWQQGLYIVFIQYILFVITDLVGIVQWTKSIQKA